MTKEQVQNLCAELGMKMIDFRNRIIYCNYVVGNYYYDIYESDYNSFRISFIGSCLNTKSYETARKEAIRKTKEIKNYIANKKLKNISEDF